MALVGGSALGIAAQPVAQAGDSSETTLRPASASDGVLGAWSDVATPGGASFLNGNVKSLLFVDDTLFVGGWFKSVPGVDDTFVAAWSSVDDTWHSITSTTLTGSGPAYSLAMSPDDTLYVGGDFTTPGGGTNVAALSGGTWHDLLLGTNAPTHELIIRDDTLYAGGSFSFGINKNWVAEWPVSGGSWIPLGNETLGGGGFTGVLSMAWLDDSLIIGAYSLTAPTQDVAWLHRDDSLWQPLGGPSSLYGLNERVEAIAIANGTPYFAGRFTADEPTGVNNLKHIAAWSLNDDTWIEVGGGLTPSSPGAYALAADDTHQILYVGGDFDAAGSTNASNIAAWDLRLSEWIPLQWSTTNQGLPSSASNTAYAIALDDSVVYVGGYFFDAGNNANADRLARWTWEPPQGSVDDTYTGSNLPVSGEGFVGVAPTGAVTLDDTITPTTYTVAGYTVDDSATITLTNLTGVPSGIYEMRVEGVGGEGSIGTLRVNTTTVPSAPQTPAASAGNASATVTWTAPASTGGAAITQYDVTSSPGGLTCSATPPTTSCVVTGLTNGTSYSFDITATNSVGASAAATTNSVTPVNPTPPTPTKPGAPTNVSGTPGDGQVSVTWQAPADSGTYAVTDYQVTASPGGSTCIAMAPTLTCTVTGLTNGTAYTFTVKALSGAGWGADSAPSAAVTPQAPRNPTIMITGSRSPGNEKRVLAEGVTTDLVGEVVQARVHLAGEEDYYDGSRRTVKRDGTFTWQRLTNKRVYLYFRHELTRSNRIVIKLGTR